MWQSSVISGDRQTPLREVNNLADDLRRLSDTILLEDSFSTLAIPSLAGSVDGFGFDDINSISCPDQVIDKLAKEKNKKP